MPPALRTALLHAQRLTLLHFGQSSATQSAFHYSGESCFVMRSASAHHLDPPRQYALLPFCHVNSQACMHHVQVSMCSHVHTSSSEGISLRAVSLQGIDMSSSTPPAPCISARCKGQKKSQSGAAALQLLHQKVSLLELEQVSLADATILSKSRAFKSTSFENLAAVVKLLRELLGSGEKVCRALAMNPGFISHQPDEHLEQKLKLLVDFGIKSEVVRKLCTTPKVLPLKVEPLHKKLSVLEEIGLSGEARNRLLLTYPGILRSADGCILRAFDFFKSIGMSGKEILHAWCRNPTLLLQSVDSIRKKYDVFQQFGFSVNELSRCARAGLPVMETLQAKIKSLEDRGFSDSDAHVLISKAPSILSLADKALKSKLDFLLCEQNYDLADIMRGPACLTYSLQGRMIPRFNFLKGKGLSKVYSLSTILSYSDQRFQKLARRGKGQ